MAVECPDALINLQDVVVPLMNCPVDVLILTSVHHPFDTRIYHREAKTLVEAGYKVTIIAAQAQTHQTVQGINFIGIKRPRWRLGRVLNWLTFIKLALKAKADIYHFHDPDLLIAGLFLKLSTGKPVIYDNHDPYIEAILQREWLPLWSRSIVSTLFGVIEKTIAANLVVIVANERQCQRFPKATLIRNYPDLTAFESQLEPPTRKQEVIYAGSLSEARGMFDLIKIAEALKPTPTVISVLGPIPNQQLEDQVKHMVAQKQLEPMIKFEGRVPYDQIVSRLRHASVGIIPFQDVPDHAIIIPTKLFEYAACGLPVVASDLPPIRQYMTEMNCGLLVEPGNPQAFAEAVIYLLHHPQEARRLGQNGQLAVFNRYNWATEAERLLELYRSLLSQTQNHD